MTHKLLAAVAVLSLLTGCADMPRCARRCASIVGPIAFGLAVGIIAASAGHARRSSPTWALRTGPGPAVQP